MSAFSTLLLSLGPSLYWPLDSVAGATDQSGNARNGTAVGPTIGGDTSEPLVDGVGGSTLLDGIDDRITSTYNPWTLGAVRSYGGFALRNTDTTTDTVVGGTAGNGTNRRPLILTFSTDASPSGATIDADEGVAGVGTWADAIPTGQWVFWVVIHDDTALTGELFVNGQSKGVVTGLNPLSALNTTMGYQLGMSRSTLNPYDGKLAHAFVFESALTPASIISLAELAASPRVVAGTFDPLLNTKMWF